MVTNYGGGATKWEVGGHVKFYPYEKRGWGGGGAEKGLAMLKGGGGDMKSFGVVFTG